VRQVTSGHDQPSLDTWQRLPRDAELLAFEAACEEYCEHEVDEVEWQGGRVYLHLGARRGRPAALADRSWGWVRGDLLR
jgi:hypothetical protein